MTNKPLSETIKTLLNETFIAVEGHYLDKNTSFIESLQQIDAQEASKMRLPINNSIAAHVKHVIFYIKVLRKYADGTNVGKTDWSLSWQITTVTEQEWQDTIDQLQLSYEGLLAYVNTIESWDNEDTISAILSIMLHCSYHLGAIRQLIRL